MSDNHPDIKKIEEEKNLYIDNQKNTGVSSWFNFSNGSYLMGFTIAAGITLVAASPKVRESIVKGGVKTWEYLQGGIEELKEKVQDVRAEMSEKKKKKPARGFYEQKKR
eukprot:gnl/Chilomastix_cuspidata/9662.p1 GENE.gnl/Chilomastix_cuspidata/9662~~gnl/Chilomastix_cuspidata/9662.p1  ORF type:complete len:109 (-),score=7.66 gnl/Chilomastix_cuspidata/9662:524-850(-)